jgi:hypothetical protein
VELLILLPGPVEFDHMRMGVRAEGFQDGDLLQLTLSMGEGREIRSLESGGRWAWLSLTISLTYPCHR